MPRSWQHRGTGCNGCDTCAAGYALSQDKKSCTQASGGQRCGRACSALLPGLCSPERSSLGWHHDALLLWPHPTHRTRVCVCLQCAVENCATYDANTCTCTACAANFKLVDGACTAVSGWPGWRAVEAGR